MSHFAITRSLLLSLLILALLAPIPAAAKPAVAWEEVADQFPALTRTNISSNDPSTTAIRHWLTQLRQAWLDEQDGERREILRWRLWEDAADTFEDQYLDEVIAGGTLADTEVRCDAATKTVQLKRLQALPEMLVDDYLQWNFRMVGEKHFECWTTSTGYLFSLDGELIKKATIKRKDGRGREWYGAFLPSGAYCTTDIWHHDRQLHVFTKSDKWLRSVKMTCPIAWARSAEDGSNWIVRSSTDHCGSELVRVSADGTTAPLKGLLGDAVAWRKIGPYRQGTFVELVLPSDDSSHVMATYTVGHGRGAELMDYHLYPAKGERGGIPQFAVEDALSSTTLYYGWRRYGFFPDSLCLWAERRDLGDGVLRTWLLDAEGKVTGWVAGNRIGEGAVAGSELFGTSGGAVLTVAPEGGVLEVRQFEMGGKNVEPVWLMDKDKVGFFIYAGGLHVARW